MISKTVPAALTALFLTACAAPSASFSPEAQPISAQALQQRLAGKTYTARTAKGQGWEMRYGSDGRMSMSVSDGSSDKGRWRTEDNRLCVDFEGKFPSGCSEIRVGSTTRLYLKRASIGEVVVLDTAN